MDQTGRKDQAGGANRDTATDRDSGTHQAGDQGGHDRKDGAALMHSTEGMDGEERVRRTDRADRKKLLILIGLGVLILASIAYGLSASVEERSAADSGRLIGFIDLQGVIVSGAADQSLFGAVPGADSVIEQLRSAQEDGEVDAVVLRINSPGGSAAASEEIRTEVMKLREAGKLVIASLGDVAASGGYWVASAADSIMAGPATITGSIGVIMELQNLSGLFDKIGIESKVIKAGEFKDMGSPSRDLTEEERVIFQEMVDDIYDQFIEVVSEGRDLEEDEVRKLATGRVFTGRQAKNLGLVDHIGGFYDAVELAARQVGIDGRPQLKTYVESSPLAELFGSLGIRKQLRLPVLFEGLGFYAEHLLLWKGFPGER
ncbi:MAG: signal peptide peptidase SppA [Firmicutes bacterium]|nr:signal peptide peptidase SppA [Bacillota bacterium]